MENKPSPSGATGSGESLLNSSPTKGECDCVDEPQIPKAIAALLHRAGTVENTYNHGWY